MGVREIDITFDAIYLQMDKDYIEVVDGKKKKRDENDEKTFDLKNVGKEETRVRLLELKW